MDLKFEDFIKSGIYLRNWSQKTVRTYRQGLNALEQSLRQGGDSTNTAADEKLSKTQLDAFVIWMRQKGLSAGGCNMYIRTVNSYLSWLHEEEHIAQHLRIKAPAGSRAPSNRPAGRVACRRGIASASRDRG